MLGKIIEMSDILHDVLKDERELNYWRKGYEIRKKNAQFEFWTGRSSRIMVEALK